MIESVNIKSSTSRLIKFVSARATKQGKIKELKLLHDSLKQSIISEMDSKFETLRNKYQANIASRKEHYNILADNDAQVHIVAISEYESQIKELKQKITSEQAIIEMINKKYENELNDEFNKGMKTYMAECDVIAAGADQKIITAISEAFPDIVKEFK